MHPSVEQPKLQLQTITQIKLEGILGSLHWVSSTCSDTEHSYCSTPDAERMNRL